MLTLLAAATEPRWGSLVAAVGILIAFGGFPLLGGWAVDLFGPREVFVLGLTLYAVSSLAGGLATTPLLLVLARAGQGLGGALLFPATLTLVSTGFAEGPGATAPSRSGAPPAAAA